MVHNDKNNFKILIYIIYYFVKFQIGCTIYPIYLLVMVLEK